MSASDRDRVPSFLLAGEDGARLSNETLLGVPLVIAVTTSWDETGERCEDELAAELRGLGARLLVVTKDLALSFGPDDRPRPFEPFSRDPAVWTAFRSALCAGSATGSRLLVADEGGMIVFRHAATEEDVGSALLEGLRLANRALAKERRRGHNSFGVSRRTWVAAALSTAFAAAFLEGCKPGTQKRRFEPNPAAGPRETREVRFRLNDEDETLLLDPRTTLLDTLREKLGLTGTKKGCDHGQCGACTVLVDGLAVNACLTLALTVDGAHVETIEGLAHGDELHPVQKAFLERDGYQCGYCTPGQIMSAVALVRQRRVLSPDDVRERMSGNICRCGAYVNIVDAVLDANGRA